MLFFGAAEGGGGDGGGLSIRSRTSMPEGFAPSFSALGFGFFTGVGFVASGSLAAAGGFDVCSGDGDALVTSGGGEAFVASGGGAGLVFIAIPNSRQRICTG